MAGEMVNNKQCGGNILLHPDPDLDYFQTVTGTSSKIFIKIRSVVLCKFANRQTNRQTDKQTPDKT